MIVTVRKWGKSLGVRIPTAVAKNAGFSEGTEVELAVQDGTVVLRRVEVPLLSETAGPNEAGEPPCTGGLGQAGRQRAVVIPRGRPSGSELAPSAFCRCAQHHCGSEPVRRKGSPLPDMSWLQMHLPHAQ